MVRRPEPTLREATLSAEQLEAGISRLSKRLDEVRAFDPASVREQFDIPHVESLSASIDDALLRTFGPDTHDYVRYKSASEFDNGPFNYAYDVPISEVHKSLARSKDRNIALLEQAIRSLEERRAELSQSRSNPSALAPARPHSPKVFIVHGRQDGPKEAVARFLSQLGLLPIILHEQPNQGRTIIEKIEAYSDVGFAVVLLTPDDEGNLKGEAPKDRARQNVLLELGYFLGKLTRGRVCTLKVGAPEVPSDWAGVIDEPFDGASGAWKQTLARELEAAGYPVDWNKVMRG